MIQFIDEHRERFSIEFICKTLRKHCARSFITSRDYRPSKARGLNSHRLRDIAVMERIGEVRAKNCGVYWIYKMWHALRRHEIYIRPEQTAPLRGVGGVAGKGKGGSPITTCSLKSRFFVRA